MEEQTEVLKDGVWAALKRRDVSRRAFLRFCAVMTGALALPLSYTPRIAHALEQTTRPAPGKARRNRAIRGRNLPMSFYKRMANIAG